VTIFGGSNIVTCQDEFTELSELHRHQVEAWLEGKRNTELVIEESEAERDFLRQWMSSDGPGRN